MFYKRLAKSGKLSKCVSLLLKNFLLKSTHVSINKFSFSSAFPFTRIKIMEKCQNIWYNDTKKLTRGQKISRIPSKNAAIRKLIELCLEHEEKGTKLYIPLR
jgi:hypothetical protein